MKVIAAEPPVSLSITFTSTVSPVMVTSVARLCFSKLDATLDEGIRRLARARESGLKT